MARIKGRWPTAIAVALIVAGATAGTATAGTIAAPGPATFAPAPTPNPSSILNPTASSSQPTTASFGMRAGLHGKTTLEGDHFTYAMPAGTTVNDTLVLINYGDQPVTIQVYSADLISAEGGGLAPAQRTDPQRSAGRWIHLDTEQVTVPAKQSVSVAFRVTVPEGSSPGEHLGALVGSTIAGQTANGLAIETRVALQARVRVRGTAQIGLTVDRPNASPAGGGQRFDVTVHNTGNVLLTVNGVLTVGTEEITLTPAGVYVIPGGEASFTGTWTNPPLLGKRSAAATFAAHLDNKPAGEFTSPGRELTFIPRTLLIALLLLLAALAATWYLTRTRRHRWLKRRRIERELIARHRAASDLTPSAAPVSGAEPAGDDTERTGLTYRKRTEIRFRALRNPLGHSGRTGEA